jgi:lauroyl/myristoyl acyltransferase
MQPNPSQAPTMGRLKRLLGPLYFNGVFWYRFQYWAGATLPHWFLSIMTRIMSSLFFLALHGVRRGLRTNHRLIDPTLGWWQSTWRAYQTVHVFSWCVTERNQQFEPDRELEISIEGQEHWDAAREGGRGVVMVTSHIGGWEISSSVASANECNAVIHVVREREADPKAQVFIEELMAQLPGGDTRVHFAGEGNELGMELYGALRDGELVALQGDRPRQGGKVERVQLFGETVSLPPGPAQLARLADVAFVPVFTFREGTSRYRIVFREPIRVAQSRNRKQDVHDACQALATEIEWAIASHPTQWFCFSDVRAS